MRSEQNRLPAVDEGKSEKSLQVVLTFHQYCRLSGLLATDKPFSEAQCGGISRKTKNQRPKAPQDVALDQCSTTSANAARSLNGQQRHEKRKNSQNDGYVAGDDLYLTRLSSRKCCTVLQPDTADDLPEFTSSATLVRFIFVFCINGIFR